LRGVARFGHAPQPDATRRPRIRGARGPGMAGLRLIRCTQKLLAEIPTRLIDTTATGRDWHANLLHVDRRKCALFTHDLTLYSIFCTGLRKPEFEKLGNVFSQRLFKTMLIDEFSQEHIEKVLGACETIRFARSANRSVLGSMNDLRYQIKVRVASDGGLANADPDELQYRINRIPFKAIRLHYPVEMFREYVAEM
jgi:hypothetical protein